MLQTSCMKMMREKAAHDRVITDFPQAFMTDATPYPETDFDHKVREGCRSDWCIKIGLKISKAIFVGDVSVGKTCLVNRFCHSTFDANYKATIGVDFEVERFDVLNTPLNLQIWDTAGQERFKCIASAYYRGAHVVAVVFDLSNLLSLHHTAVWLEETLENNFQSPIVFLVGTKKDLVSEATFKVVEQHAIRMARGMKAEYWAVSSKSGENVQEFFFRIASLAFNASVLRELESPEAKDVTKDFVKIQGKSTGDPSEARNRSKCSSACHSQGDIM